MTPTKLLIGQILVCLCVVLFGVWGATQWTAATLGHQPQLGAPWFTLFETPIYQPWQLFGWWFHYGAYAPAVFDRAGIMAATSGFLACGAAIGGSLWRARQNRKVTTYGSSRWATRAEIAKAGLFRSGGVFLGRYRGEYQLRSARHRRGAGDGGRARHGDGPDHPYPARLPADRPL